MQCWSLSIVERCMWREGARKSLSLSHEHTHTYTYTHIKHKAKPIELNGSPSLHIYRSVPHIRACFATLALVKNIGGTYMWDLTLILSHEYAPLYTKGGVYAGYHWSTTTTGLLYQEVAYMCVCVCVCVCVCICEHVCVYRSVMEHWHSRTNNRERFSSKAFIICSLAPTGTNWGLYLSKYLNSMLGPPP